MEWLGAIALAGMLYAFGKNQGKAAAERFSILVAMKHLKDYEEDYAQSVSKMQDRADQYMMALISGPVEDENAFRRDRIGKLLGLLHQTGMATSHCFRIPPNEGRDQIQDELKRRRETAARAIGETLKEYEEDLERHKADALKRDKADAERETSQQG